MRTNWLIQTDKFIDRDQNPQYRINLVAPNYQPQSGLASETINPTIPYGEYTIYNNGWGTLQICDKNGDAIAFIPYNDGSKNNKDAPDASNALGIAMTLVDALKSKAT